jgi:hypothetical protein
MEHQGHHWEKMKYCSELVAKTRQFPIDPDHLAYLNRASNLLRSNDSTPSYPHYHRVPFPHGEANVSFRYLGFGEQFSVSLLESCPSF